MSEASARFDLPFLQAGQAQKEIWHNEALAVIDVLLHPVAQDFGVDTPPSAPTAGQCWILGTAPIGAWEGRAGSIAAWTGGGWRFVAPREGLSAWVADENMLARHDGTTWTVGIMSAARYDVGGQQVVGNRQAAIADPTGGTTIDLPARAAISGILATLRTHGLIAT
jgi:hypothetical protein